MSEQAPACDELRLALVLNGGVSLAIWMSGVVAEIDALRRADEAGAAGSGDAGSSVAIYARLVAALGLRVRVDVIAGTSAGGLNGGMLAAAVATGQPFAGVRDLWMKVGDLRDLLRLGEVEQGLPSLLKGEKVLYGELKNRFQEALDGPVDASRADDAARRVRLIVTGTDVAGVSHDTQDSFGGTLAIVDHRLRARFAHVGDAEAADVPVGWGEMLPPDRDARLGMAEAMARAARTSASFPFAFEPSELSLWADGAAGPTPLGQVLVTRDGQNVAAAMQARAAAKPTEAPPFTRYAIDGGVLDNSPVGAVLETITSLSSEAPVQRVVVFVVPYADDAAAPAGRPPGAGKVLGTVLNMPRDVAIADHLEEVERDLARRAGDRTSFDELLSLPAGQLADLAAQLYPTFWRLRAATSLWTLAQRYRARLAEPPAVDVSLPDARTRDALVAAAEAVDARWLPPRDARPADLWSSADDGGPEWRFGGAPATRVALRIADWIKGAREALEPGDASRPALRDCQTAVHRALLAYRTGEVARQRAEAAAVADAQGTLQLEALARLSNATWTDERCAAGRTLLAAAAEALVTARACTLSREARDRLRVGPDEAAIAADDMARRLLQADVAWRGLRGPLEDEYQASARYEFLRLNATAPVAFGDGRAGRPQDKLFGMQLGHFAAFMCGGWRANDWLWGRLDGAARLVDLLLAPTRLRLSPLCRVSLAEALDVADVPAFLAAAPFRNHDSELVEADDDGELRFWRGAFREALAEAIVGAELGALATALGEDVGAGFDGEPDLCDALGATGSARARFAAYAGLLCGADGGTGIEARVARERRSDAGRRLLADTADVAADLLATIGGPFGTVGRALEVPTDVMRTAVGLRGRWHAALHHAFHGDPDEQQPADAG
jgi:predicted acylesterase/phospholipase RssA